MVAACWLPACSPTLAGPSNLIKLGSWNIEHLGERGRGQSGQALAQHMYLAGVDVLALQEIHDTDGDPATRTNARLDQALDYLSREPGHTWRYQLLKKRDDEDTNLLMGVAWNQEKVTLDETWKVPVEYANAVTFRRTPYAFMFRTGAETTDFVVVPLHLKSSFGGQEKGAATRAREGQALAAVIPKIRRHFGSENDIILAGDFNCVSHSEEALGYLKEIGFRDLNRKDAPTYHKGPYASPLDRILTPRDEPEFRYSWQYVLTPSDPGGHLGRLSDHFLIMTVMRILKDDD